MDRDARKEKIRSMIKSRGKLGSVADQWGVSRYRLAQLTDRLPDQEVLGKFVDAFSADPSDFWDDSELESIRTRSGSRGRPSRKKVASPAVPGVIEVIKDPDTVDADDDLEYIDDDL
jgi:hypothetical protein